jgi:hypothetical protein
MADASALQAIHDEFVAEFRGTTVGARIWERFKGRIITTVLSNPSLKALAIELLTSAYDKVIVPIDIPGIPDALETELEAWGREQIPFAVEWALARFAPKTDGEPTTPAPTPGLEF